MNWQDARGWLGPTEAMALRELAGGKEVLEIGSYCGRSALLMAEVARKVWCLDWFRGDKDCGTENTFREFLTNVQDSLDRIVILGGRIEDIGPRLTGGFDLVYVDGAHDYESAKRDSELALRLGKVVAWHDWGYEPIVKAVTELGVSPKGTAGSLMWFWSQSQPMTAGLI